MISKERALGLLGNAKILLAQVSARGEVSGQTNAKLSRLMQELQQVISSEAGAV